MCRTLATVNVREECVHGMCAGCNVTPLLSGPMFLFFSYRFIIGADLGGAIEPLLHFNPVVKC